MTRVRDYDHEKLEIFFEQEIQITDWTKLIGRVYAYDGSEKRMKILSEITRPDGQKRILKQFPPLKSAAQLKQLGDLIEACTDLLDE